MVILIHNKAISPLDILVSNWFWISLANGFKILSYEAINSGGIHESSNMIFGYAQITHEPSER